MYKTVPLTLRFRTCALRPKFAAYFGPKWCCCEPNSCFECTGAPGGLQRLHWPHEQQYRRGNAASDSATLRSDFSAALSSAPGSTACGSTNAATVPQSWKVWDFVIVALFQSLFVGRSYHSLGTRVDHSCDWIDMSAVCSRRSNVHRWK